jgi:hypothetical protein
MWFPWGALGGFEINHVVHPGAPRVRAGRAEQEGSRGGSEEKGK